MRSYPCKTMARRRLTIYENATPEGIICMNVEFSHVSPAVSSSRTRYRPETLWFSKASVPTVEKSLKNLPPSNLNSHTPVDPERRNSSHEHEHDHHKGRHQDLLQGL